MVPARAARVASAKIVGPNREGEDGLLHVLGDGPAD
jgi:hypothetical protein